MRLNNTNEEPLHLDKGDIEEISSFTYLGSIVSTDGGTDEDIKARIGKARVAFNLLKKVWKARDITTSTKLRIFNSNVKSALLYGSETWRITKVSIRKGQVFINKCLRRILRIWWPEKISNEDLWRVTDQEPVEWIVSRRKWTWIGHTLRKPKDHITRQALTWNPSGKRRRGRPKKTWRRCVEEDYRKKVLGWAEVEKVSQDRGRWRLFVDGLYSVSE